MTDPTDFDLSQLQMEYQSNADEDEAESEGSKTQFSQQTAAEHKTDGKTQHDAVSQNSAEPKVAREEETESQDDELLSLSSTTDGELEEDEFGDDESDTEFAFEENLETFDVLSLPLHACGYCGIHSTDSVVRCDDCQRWFCNDTGNTTGAHIINHLVRSRHKRVSLHSENPLGKTTLECFNCGGNNVFLLGFIPAKSESIVVILCREPCLTLNSLKEMNWDLSQWIPLIKDRVFLSWLVNDPGDKQKNQAINLSAGQISKLEELWIGGNAAATIEDLERNDLSDEVRPVMVSYPDSAQYRAILDPLIMLESDHEKKMKETQSQQGINIRWGLGFNSQHLFYFRLNRALEVNVRVVPGDAVILTYPGDVVNAPWKCCGVVLRITTSDEIIVSLEGCKDPPLTQVYGFNVDFVFKPIPYKRMYNAVNAFDRDEYSVTGYLFHKLLGHDIEPQTIRTEGESNFSAPGLPPLNKSQSIAVKNALEQPLSLIQGPPGTGKTVTSASLVYHLTRQKRGQILVCAPSNIGVDQLTAKIHATGMKVVRMVAQSREKVDSSVDFLYLNRLVKHLAKETGSDFCKLDTLKEMQGDLSKRDMKRYRQERSRLEKELLESADIICTTCVGAGDVRLAHFRFKQVVIDESTQATEPEAMVPIVKGAKQIVLIGDHCQLGPVIMCKKAAKAGLHRSLFERIIMLGTRPMRLQVQYRMHPCLSEFPSNTFYEGSLQNGVSVEERRQKPGITFEWPDPDFPMFFYCSVGQEEFSASGTSYLNRVEAINVEKLVTTFLKSGIKPDQIGVVTPYEGQRQYIIGNMLRTGSLRKDWYEAIEVANVDAFQGREKDYIILSCVRSNENLGIGFLSDPRRLNVALTRARYGLVVIGNPKVLSRSRLWHSLLTHFKKKRLVLEGILSDLQESCARLSEPKDYYEHRKILAADDMAREEHEDKEYYRNKSKTSPEKPSQFYNAPSDKAQRNQFDYAYPGEIGPNDYSGQTTNKNAFRPPVINRKQHTEDFNKTRNISSVARFSSQESLMSQTISEDDSSFTRRTQQYESDRQEGLTQEDLASQKKSLGGFEGMSGLSQGFNEHDDDFTQHLQSQDCAIQTQPESQLELDLNDLSLGGYSQELNSDTEEMESDNKGSD